LTYSNYRPNLYPNLIEPFKSKINSYQKPTPDKSMLNKTDDCQINAYHNRRLLKSTPNKTDDC